MRKSFLLMFCFLCVLSKGSEASEFSALQSQVNELASTVKDLRLVIETQQSEIQMLKASQVQAPPVPTPVSTSESGRSLQGRWNPDIGAVADVVTKLDSPRADTEGADRVSVRELELVLGSAVDPYSRLDATVSFPDFEAASLEEAYYTHYGLPWGITGRLGRFKPNIGKAIPLHRESLETVDEPLVIQRYFGLEGYNKSGADLRRPLDLPWASANELAIGVLEGGNGDGGTLFGSARRRPTLYGHLKNYWDLDDLTGLELGISHLTGSRDADSTFEVSVFGLDGTFIYRFADQRHLKLQAEVFRASRTESFVVDDTTGAFNDLDDNRNLWGGYGLLDLRFHPRWSTGFRFDAVELVDNAIGSPHPADIGYTGYLTFYQSEFARWRAQFSHIDLATGNDDNQILLQGTFAIGEHKHKLQ